MANNYKLPIMPTVQEAWHTVKGRKATIWGALGWVFLIGIFLNIITAVIQAFQLSDFNSVATVLQIFTPFLMILLMLGIVRIGIRIAKGEPIGSRMVFYTVKRFGVLLKLIGYWIIISIILVPFIAAAAALIYLQYKGSPEMVQSPGYLLLFALVPSFIGLYLGIRMRFGWGFILDKDFGPWEAFKASFRITRNNFWRLFGLMMVNSLIIFVALLPLGLGLIWVKPYVYICYGVAYRNLLEGQK